MWAKDMAELLLDLNILVKCHGGVLPLHLAEWMREEYRKIISLGFSVTGGEVLARPPGQVGKRGRIAKQNT
jgi:hypothetical protein